MKYKIKNHIIDAKSPVEALKIHKLLDSVKDAYLLQLKNDRDVYWQEDEHFGRSKKYAKRFDTYEEAKTKADAAVSNWRDVIDIIKDSVRDNYTKDEAFDRQTIEALIADETAAIDAYNVAIANLKGKISDIAIQVLQNIRNDEQNHVANLNAILSNNITEKNLEDSIKDAEYKAFYKGKELKRGDELVDFRGDKSYYYGCYHPRKITVSEDKAGNDLQEYYPSVFNVEIKA